MSKSMLVIVARIISGASGYLVLAVAANILSPGQFAQLVLFQTTNFVFQILADSGFISVGYRRASSEKHWQDIVGRFQGIRYFSHLCCIAPFLILYWAGWFITDDPFLPLVSAIALMSNALNTDWILFCRQQERKWAVKIIASAFVNVAVSVFALNLLSTPTAVMLGVVGMNIAGWLIVVKMGYTKVGRVHIPTIAEVKYAVQYSTASSMSHLGYSSVILIPTMYVGGTIAGGFAVLYRLFSACTMLVPPAGEFMAAKLLASTKTTNIPKSQMFIRLAGTSLLLVSPFLIIPFWLLHEIVSFGVDLSKYDVKPIDVLMVQIALVLFALQFSVQKLAFVLDCRRNLIVSASIALACCLISSYVAQKIGIQQIAGWFLPLFTLQLVDLLILGTLVSLRPQPKTVD